MVLWKGTALAVPIKPEIMRALAPAEIVRTIEHAFVKPAQGTAVVEVLPAEIARGATLRGNEYGWIVSAFPDALGKAKASGYACLGGQFQFRLDDGTTCEMYWLDADSKERIPGESWASYAHRSCSEVLNRFQHLASATDFRKEASSWPSIQIDTTRNLVFVAYFVTEIDLASTNG